MSSGSGSGSKPGMHYAEFYGTTDGVPFYYRTDTVVPYFSSSSFTRTSTVTPGYRRLANPRAKKHKGLDLPMNPYSFSSTRDTGKFGEISSTTLYNNGNVVTARDSGCYDSNIAPPTRNPDVVEALNIKVRNKMLGRLHDQSVNLGNAIGEGRQTVNLFATNAKRLAGAASDLRSGNLVGAANRLLVDTPSHIIRGQRAFRRDLRRDYPRALANGWLELQYGWKPLLSDIFGSCQFLANRLYAAPRFKQRASVTQIVSDRRTDVISDNFRSNVYTEGRYTETYIVYYSQSGNHDLASLGLINPAAIAWELTPFSFVVDWALPIGTWLNNLDATYGLTFVKGCHTSFWQGTSGYKYFGVPSSYPGFKVLANSNVAEEVVKVEISRERLNEFPANPLPRLKNPFGQFKSLIDPGDHALNALALLKQSFSLSKGSPKGPSAVY